MSLREFLSDGVKDFNIELSETQLDLFFLYLENLKKWNYRINLTAIKNDRDIVLNHFIDSTSIAPFIDNGKKLLDIGSGGGFPGIPLKIIRDELDVTLLDSVNKKVSFLNDTIRKLELQKIKAMWGRAEDLNNDIERNSFDYVLTRAVGRISEIAKLSHPYLAEGGIIVLMRGKKGLSEWNEVKQELRDKFELVEIKEFNLPQTDQLRTIIVLKPLSK